MPEPGPEKGHVEAHPVGIYNRAEVMKAVERQRADEAAANAATVPKLRAVAPEAVAAAQQRVEDAYQHGLAQDGRTRVLPMAEASDEDFDASVAQQDRILREQEEARHAYLEGGGGLGSKLMRPVRQLGLIINPNKRPRV